MTSKHTFYRNVITIEVLSEDPLSGNESLSDIAYLIKEGSCSGKVETTTDNEPVDGRRMAQLLQGQGSEPGFFGLDEEGRDVDSSEGEEAEDGEDDNTILPGDDTNETPKLETILANGLLINRGVSHKEGTM